VRTGYVLPWWIGLLMLPFMAIFYSIVAILAGIGMIIQLFPKRTGRSRKFHVA